MSKTSMLVAGIVVGIAINSICVTLKSKKKLSYRTIDSENDNDQTDNSRTYPRKVPIELENELFSRNIQFFGELGFSQIKHSFIVVVGLGGVGSHAAHMLARSGVKSLRLIDFDQVTLSSLNRHAVATWEDVGFPKAIVLRKKLQSICPGINVDARVQMFRDEDAEELLSGNPDYVLDCIDDVTTKSELLAYCVKNRLKVISSVGAALKSDPTRLQIGTLIDAIRDPLAAKLRWRLKKHEIDAESIQCVCIAASPVGELTPLSDEQASAPKQFGVVDHFRLRTLPVLGTIPAIFGQTMATWVLCELGNKQFLPATMVGLGRALRNKLLQRLKSREHRFHPEDEFSVDLDDISFMVDYWRGRCAVSNARMVGHEQLELTRWNSAQPLAPNNIVLLSVTVLKQMDSEGRDIAISIHHQNHINKMLKQLQSNW